MADAAACLRSPALLGKSAAAGPPADMAIVMVRETNTRVRGVNTP